MDNLCALLASPKGFWFLLAFFHLSLASSLMVHPTHTKEPTSKNQPANITDCLTTAAQLMEEASDSLHHFKETSLNSCTMELIQPDNPNNEENIQKACMPGFCMQEASDVVDQDLCMDTIYKILKIYEVKIRTFYSPKLFNTVNHMMRALKSDHKITEQRAFAPHPLKQNFGNDLKQCRNLLILQQLSNTIHRNLNYLQNYISSRNVEHN